MDMDSPGNYVWLPFLRSFWCCLIQVQSCLPVSPSAHAWISRLHFSSSACFPSTTRNRAKKVFFQKPWITVPRALLTLELMYKISVRPRRSFIVQKWQRCTVWNLPYNWHAKSKPNDITIETGLNRVVILRKAYPYMGSNSRTGRHSSMHPLLLPH